MSLLCSIFGLVQCNLSKFLHSKALEQKFCCCKLSLKQQIGLVEYFFFVFVQPTCIQGRRRYVAVEEEEGERKG